MQINRIGLSTFVLASPFTDSHLPLFKYVRDIGYDLVEIGLEDLSKLTPSRVRESANEVGLAVSIGGAFGDRRDLSHESAEIRREGMDYLLACISFAAEVGAHIVSGPMYSAVGKARMLPDSERRAQRELAVAGVQSAADYAAGVGVSLAVEPLNRFETDMINTVEQAIEFCSLVDRENVGLTLDTFHMNIEETNIANAVRSAGSLLLNFQASENDRGAPGQGHVPWQEIFGALREIDYRGAVVVESFRPDVIEIARSVSLWRPVAASMDDLARDSVKFLREGLL